uniref:lactoylglutathione lyase n=1 Tax=Acanthochromis polyacanthus TaxID=80966 RepID=A0A3Q1G8Z5_9TELE
MKFNRILYIITQDLMLSTSVQSLDFYIKILGMTLLQKFDFPSIYFSLFFLGYEDKKEIPTDVKEKTFWTFSRRATTEGRFGIQPESDESKSYHNGNSDPRALGHIGIAVSDIYEACKLFEEQGVTLVKKSDDSKINSLAFIQDLDDDWIEILSSNDMVSIIFHKRSSEVLPATLWTFFREFNGGKK